MSRLPLERVAVALGLACWAGVLSCADAQPGAGDRAPANTRGDLRARYVKQEHAVPMRDGVRLHTAVYAPRTCAEGGAPIMLTRTPYGVGPYGPDAYPARLGPSERFEQAGFIFVYQDVRGRFLSEGEWEEVRPHVPAARLGAGEATESSDAYDTIEWLLRHVPCHNGRVGMWGISYPGFYTSSAMIEAHPALRAVSPQGPVTDYFLNDDSFHNGAFLLAHNFSFYVDFFPRGPVPGPPAPTRGTFDFGTSDHYAFYLGLGSLAEASRRHGLDANPYWMANLEHTTLDEFWKARGIWRHFRDVTPAVLTVGGWYDAENLHGALRTHAALRAGSPGTEAHLVMGPWTHGGWARGRGDRVGDLAFGADTARRFRDEIEFPFFARHLTDAPSGRLPAVTVFDTGSHEWHDLPEWPPSGTRTVTFHLGPRGTLATAPPAGPGHDTYVSDPAAPVPVVEAPSEGMPGDYMARDQRHTAGRDDVLVYVSEPLDEDMTVLGAVRVDLQVATSGTDSDFVVKLIDVHPGRALQQLVRGEPFRGKYRDSFERPVPFEPGTPTRLTFTLGEVAHTFRRGHRVMLHVQGSWFPLIDRNPQTFTHIPDARPDQFVKATHTVFHGGPAPSVVTLPAR